MTIKELTNNFKCERWVLSHCPANINMGTGTSIRKPLSIYEPREIGGLSICSFVDCEGKTYGRAKKLAASPFLHEALHELAQWYYDTGGSPEWDGHPIYKAEIALRLAEHGPEQTLEIFEKERLE